MNKLKAKTNELKKDIFDEFQFLGFTYWTLDILLNTSVTT